MTEAKRIRDLITLVGESLEWHTIENQPDWKGCGIRRRLAGLESKVLATHVQVEA